MKKPDYKADGFIPQRQKGCLIMRMRSRAGNLTAENLQAVARLASRFGNGCVHVTTRQAIEIHGVKTELYEQAKQAITAEGLLPAVCGPRIRPITACPGTDTCPYGLQNTRDLAETLDASYVGREMPAKTKIAISGCPNSCTDPQGNDIGFKGVAEPVMVPENCVQCGLCVKICPVQAMTLADDMVTIDRQACLSCGRCISQCPKDALIRGREGYHIYIGGKGGRFSAAGILLGNFVPAGQVVSHLEAILASYQKLAEKGERLQAVLARVGSDAVWQQI
ncbi:MAG TPA: 4Fe-4S dicluster domain-containing protein [Patescibacteria group bacterium]|nr:4Fe-4S dicluster domain-containing protein [Patescibacteria group bacterium]